MITEPDGFKHVDGHDAERAWIHATYDNTVLLHEQVKDLREVQDKIIQILENITQKLEGGKADEY